MAWFLAHGGLHSHGASHEIGFIPYQGLDEQTVLFSDAYFYFFASIFYYTYPLSERRCG